MGTWFERTAPWYSARLYRTDIMSCFVTPFRRLYLVTRRALAHKKPSDSPFLPKLLQSPGVRWPTSPSNNPPLGDHLVREACAIVLRLC
ncbi:hypothetical protein CEXT_610111 [Caerostris extrusa]|uniref:Uncharacterized protein n=1 Tax=Caerostris extrusa TaxID=172846 RepID=A0AAV4Y1R3_CAEEX|nr:hypothetical protein CEXT_610111 [Caerostris extrusa]